jgi:hypothetical protein
MFLTRFHSVAFFAQAIGRARTIIWNGPSGVFEFEKFAGSTKAMEPWSAPCSIRNNCACGSMCPKATSPNCRLVRARRSRRTREPGVTPVQLAREGISWDGRDADGDRPANGVYLYRIEATPVGGGPARKVTGRLVVSR